MTTTNADLGALDELAPECKALGECKRNYSGPMPGCEGVCLLRYPGGKAKAAAPPPRRPGSVASRHRTRSRGRVHRSVRGPLPRQPPAEAPRARAGPGRHPALRLHAGPDREAHVPGWRTMLVLLRRLCGRVLRAKAGWFMSRGRSALEEGSAIARALASIPDEIRYSHLAPRKIERVVDDEPLPAAPEPEPPRLVVPVQRTLFEMENADV